MKKIYGFLLILALSLIACSAAVEHVDAATVGTEFGNTSVDDTRAVNTPIDATDISLITEGEVDTSVGNLSAAEVDGLLFMREEEKLARDVYLTLYGQWDVPIFQNIARSESTHMDAILTLLDRYGLEDPAADNGVSQFTNPELQVLYDQLVNQGAQSLLETLKVGAAIE